MQQRVNMTVCVPTFFVTGIKFKWANLKNNQFQVCLCTIFKSSNICFTFLSQLIQEQGCTLFLSLNLKNTLYGQNCVDNQGNSTTACNDSSHKTWVACREPWSQPSNKFGMNWISQCCKPDPRSMLDLSNDQGSKSLQLN